MIRGSTLKPSSLMFARLTNGAAMPVRDLLSGFFSFSLQLASEHLQ
jgi:hypothetical protein